MKTFDSVSLVLFFPLEVEQLLQILPLATTAYQFLCDVVIWYPNIILKIIYVEFETSEAQWFTPNIMLSSLVLVLICSYIVFHVWSQEQKKNNYFTRWEGNWGKGSKLTFSSLHIRLVKLKTEAIISLHPSSSAKTGFAWVLRFFSCE